MEQYNGHCIKVVNGYTKLELFIDDKIVDAHNGVFGLHATLKCKIDDKQINIKVSNSFTITCIAFVE